LKPIIGISVNFTTNDEVGRISHLGGALQQWQMVADDYVRAVERAGGIPVLIPVYERIEEIESLVSKLDGMLFTGGNDIEPKYYGEEFSKLIGEISPRRDSHEMRLISHIIERTEIPILGICRGHQLINIALGGSLYQDMKSSGMEDHFYLNSPMSHPIHHVEVDERSRLGRINGKGKLGVNSYHHQCIKEVGRDLVVTARHGKIVEAVEYRGERFILGVQWHPETLIESYEEHLDIFKEFIRSAGGKG